MLTANLEIFLVGGLCLRCGRYDGYSWYGGGGSSVRGRNRWQSKVGGGNGCPGLFLAIVEG